MAKKIFTGKVISNKMTSTIVVEIKRKVSHPTYKKYITRVTRLKADTNGGNYKIGDLVTIVQTRHLSRDKNFMVSKSTGETHFSTKPENDNQSKIATQPIDVKIKGKEEIK